MKNINTEKLVYISTSIIASTIVILTIFSFTLSIQLAHVRTILLFTYIVIFILISLILKILHKKYEDMIINKNQNMKKWSVNLMGISRGFEELKYDYLDKRYKIEVDLFLIFVTSIIYVISFLSILFLKNYLNINMFIIRKEILATVFAIFISYSLLLVIIFLFYYEKYIVIKKGKLNVGDEVWYTLIFFLTIDISFIIKFIYDSLKIIFLKTI